ncbi:MAG: MBL fold metallo-hydrolase [Thermoproteota archaeon]
MNGVSSFKIDEETRMLVIDVTPEGYREDFIKSYAVTCKDTLYVIETGPRSSAEKILEVVRRLTREGIKQVKVIVTHIHLDHGGGLATIVNTLTQQGLDAKGLVHPRGLPHTVNPEKLWNASRLVLGHIADIYGKPEPAREDLVEPTSDGQILSASACNLQLKILHTPGHASHHQSVVLLKEGTPRVLFPGDGAGMYFPKADAVIPTTPPPFRYDMYMKSLEKMMAYRTAYVAYTHAGVAEYNVLSRHRGQMEIWAKVFEKLSSGVPLEAIYKTLSESDPELKKFSEKVGDELVVEFIKNSIAGFMEYFSTKRQG